MTNSTIPFVYDDGGRATAGFRGEAGDCGTRAIAIALDRDYRTVYDDLAAYIKAIAYVRGEPNRSPRNGLAKSVANDYLEAMGWIWTPTMKFGQGCTTHLRSDELPDGRLVARLSKHFAAVIDGVLHDTHDCSRGGTRCVYGYWSPVDASDR